MNEQKCRSCLAPIRHPLAPASNTCTRACADSRWFKLIANQVATASLSGWLSRQPRAMAVVAIQIIGSFLPRPPVETFHRTSGGALTLFFSSLHKPFSNRRHSMAAPATFSESNAIGKKPQRALLLIAVCFTLSGAAGLIYEVLWMRMLG